MPRSSLLQCITMPWCGLNNHLIINNIIIIFSDIIRYKNQPRQGWKKGNLQPYTAKCLIFLKLYQFNWVLRNYWRLWSEKPWMRPYLEGKDRGCRRAVSRAESKEGSTFFVNARGWAAQVKSGNDAQVVFQNLSDKPRTEPVKSKIENLGFVRLCRSGSLRYSKPKFIPSCPVQPAHQTGPALHSWWAVQIKRKNLLVHWTHTTRAIELGWKRQIRVWIS